MLVEIDVPNPDGVLFPGMYSDVTLNNTTADPPLAVLASASIVRTDGAQASRRFRRPGSSIYAKVEVGRDYGDRVEILQGIEDGATIVAAPTDPAQEGAPDRSGPGF